MADRELVTLLGGLKVDGIRCLGRRFVVTVDLFEDVFPLGWSRIHSLIINGSEDTRLGRLGKCDTLVADTSRTVVHHAQNVEHLCLRVLNVLGNLS